MSTTSTGEQRDRGTALSDRECEREVLSMMLAHETHSVWSVDEIARAFADRGSATDTLRRLYEAGLVHRIGEFAFPTLAARTADDLSSGAL